MDKLISFDIYADFGFLRKPFSNSQLDLCMTFNMLHKPALLGIIGAILGLKGFDGVGKVPEYYKKLLNLKVGIEPIEGFHERGIFPKASIKYNNSVGYANTQRGVPCNWILNEQVIIKPAYRCYVLIDNSIDDVLQEKLYHYITNCYAEYIPYLGKNEYTLWWNKEEVCEYSYTRELPGSVTGRLSSIINLSKLTLSGIKDRDERVSGFSCFEKLPVGFEKRGNSYQYKLEDFVYTDCILELSMEISNIFKIELANRIIKYVQLF
jgi:CRISPR-associated protein Cas5, Hmari subtype